MEIHLNDADWTVQGWWPGVPIWMESMPGIMGNPFLGVTEPVKATVPGGVHYDLWKAGIIEDPYRDRNSMLCEWVENRWWLYSTTFSVPEEHRDRTLTLVFKGIDYHAHFYLNKKKLGEHIGQFDEASFDVTDIVDKEDNKLNVLLEAVPDETGQIGYTSRTWTQKSRFAYKWDWSTRMVNIGIWDDVILRSTGSIRIGDTHIMTDVPEGIGEVRVRSEIIGKAGSKSRAAIALSFGGETIASVEKELSGAEGSCLLDEVFRIPKPNLWFPNGHGEQPLYTVHVSLYSGDCLSDERRFRTGIRALRFERNTGAPKDSLPYTILVNNVPIYGKSVNISPWDQLYANVTPEQYERNVLLLKYANINLVRINGCGLIEKDIFYDLCDQHGIMIWQDFIQSSSGIDNVPSVLPDFLELLERTAISVVKRRRNHVATTVWCGGNELMDESSLVTGELKPVTTEHPNIHMLMDIVAEHDRGKLFLPSTASGPIFGLDTSKPGQNHDVHGPHTYGGVEDHYRIYNANDCLFHGELGVNGMAGLVSLKKFLDPRDIRLSTMRESMNWRHHGEWWDCRKRDEEIFGAFTDLGRFIKASQFIQAEGLRYALEANRRRKFRNSGSSIWAFNEAFPNVSNCAFVDYYGVPKMAYYWVSKAFAPLHCSLRYDRLFFPRGERFLAQIYAHNSLQARAITIAWQVLDSSGNSHGNGTIAMELHGNSALPAGEISIDLPPMPMEVFFVRLRVQGDAEAIICENLYVFSQRKETIFSPLFELSSAKLEVEAVGATYTAKNTGSDVCLFVHGIEASGDTSVFIENNYTSLFPDEEETFTVTRLQRGGESEASSPRLEWDFFNSRTGAPATRLRGGLR